MVEPEPRIVWVRDGKRGFEAEVEGGSATIRPMTSRTGAYTWAIQVGLGKASGTADSAQEAADAANRALPQVRAEAARLQATADREAALRADIDRIEDDPDADFATIFQIEAANYENLMWIMDDVRRRARRPGIIHLIDALSREFFRRRSGR